VPTYQYTCTECGEPLEAVQSFTDAALTQCPRCGGRLRKVFSAVGVVFKGSGFYRTDSRAASKSGSNGSSSSSDSATTSTEPGSSAAKSDAGSDSSKGSSDKGSSEKPAAASPAPAAAPAPSTPSSTGSTAKK
jgi:putative FmdB family regulatory protein